MAKIFKKLFSGDTVATYDGKVVKKLTTEEPITSITGTWVLRSDATLSSLPNGTYNISITYTNSYGTTRTANSLTRDSYNGYYRLQANVNNSLYGFVTQNIDSGLLTINIKDNTFTVNSESVDELIVLWLKANATKQ